MQNKILFTVKLKKSNLLVILSSFTSAEIKEFDDFIQSPFFNKNQSVIKLYSYLKKQYPYFEEKAVFKRTVYKSVFPETEYNDGFLRTLMFTMVSLAEEYLSLKEIKSRDAYFKINLLKAYNRKNLWKHFEKECRNALNEMDRIKRRDFLYYYERFSIENERYYILQKKYINKTEKLHLNEGIYNITYNLGSYYYITMLRLYLYTLNIKELYNIELKSHELEEAYTNIQPDKFRDTPVITIFYDLANILLKEDALKFYYRAKKNFLKNLSVLHSDDSMEIFINLENFCKKMLRRGLTEFNHELFELYSLEIELGTYKLEPGGLSAVLFTSIVKSALSAGRSIWAEEFIFKHKKEINHDIRFDTVKFAEALLLFSQKKYEASLNSLMNIKHTDLYNKFEIKTLYISVYYELNKFDEMEAVIDSFRHMLNNDKFISAARKKYYVNFIRVCLKLIKLKTKPDLNIIYDIQQMIGTKDYVIDKTWIESKLKESELSLQRKKALK